MAVFPPPRAPSRRDYVLGRCWGRGRFSKRSASPPDPLSRRVVGNRLVCSFGIVRPCECGSSPIGSVVVTAADRAAATCQRWSSYRWKRRSGEGFQRAIAKPFGRLRRRGPPRLPPQKEQSCAFTRMTEDTSLPAAVNAMQDSEKPFNGLSLPCIFIASIPYIPLDTPHTRLPARASPGRKQ